MTIEIMILGVSFFFVVLIFFVTVVLLIYALDSAFGGEDFTTSQLAVEKIAEILKVRHLENGYFYDLGSCRGKFAVKLAKELPNLNILGVDSSWFRIMFSKAASVFLRNLIFKKGNIFHEDISSADVVFLYLPKELMPDLQIKLQKELKPHALAITNRVSFPSWQPLEIYDLQNSRPVLEKLFIYEKI